MCHYPKVMFTRRKKLSRMSHYMIWTWQMQDHRYGGERKKNSERGLTCVSYSVTAVAWVLYMYKASISGCDL